MKDLFKLREDFLKEVKKRYNSIVPVYFVGESIKDVNSIHIVILETPTKGKVSCIDSLYIEARVYGCNEYDVSKQAYAFKCWIDNNKFYSFRVLENIVFGQPILIKSDEWVRQIHTEII